MQKNTARCPSCEEVVELADIGLKHGKPASSLAGLGIKCPHCNEPLTVKARNKRAELVLATTTTNTPKEGS